MTNNQQFGFFDRVGEIRPSALLYTNGIGMVVDLPHASVMVLGIDDWNFDDTQPIVEDRLLAAVRKDLGPQVRELRTPPRAQQSEQDRATQRIGVPVAAFPRWLVCPYCRLLAPISSGLFRLAAPRYRPEDVGLHHDSCNKASKPAALPVRFVIACENGHLDDFPWVEYVHKGIPCAHPQLELMDGGASGQIASVYVRCRTCTARRAMADAFSDTPCEEISACTGRWPHLRSWNAQSCEDKPRPILLGASNIWFPRVYSALSIPQGAPGIAALVEQHLDVLNDVESESLLAGFRLAMKKQLSALASFTDAEIWTALTALRNNTPAGNDETINVKTPEWEAFTNPSPELFSRDFHLRDVPVPNRYAQFIESVTLVERLREVRAFIGFNRIRGANDFGDISGNLYTDRLVGISTRPPEWVPAADVRGEGIFIKFNESVINAWEIRVDASPRLQEFVHGRRVHLANRNQLEEASKPDPGLARRLLIHSFSHALMRALSLEAGYSLASLSERIYSLPQTELDGPMAGVLIYTAASDSEGTLGGLVRLGETDRLERAIDHALDAMRICASDPLCSEHPPDTEEGKELHGAACHSCLFAPETSCEMGNRWLDRTLLVETFSQQGIELFAVDP